METKRTISNGTLNAYGSYATFQSIGFRVPMMFLSLYMTTYLGITAAQMGTILLIAKSIDFCCSLVAGGIVSASNPKKGKYLPWMKTLRWVISIGAIVQVLPTGNLPLVAKGAIIVIGYAMLHGSMNFMSTSTYGLMASIAGSNMENRIAMTTRSSQITAASGIILAFGTVPLINWVGRLVGNPAMGYTLVAIFGTLFLIVGVQLLDKFCGQYDVNKTPANYQRPKVSDMFKAIFTNDQMVLYMVYQIVNQVGAQIVAGMAMYYWTLLMNKYNLYSVSTGISTCMGFVWSLFMPKLGKKMGRVKAQVASISFSIVSKFLMFFFALKNIWYMCAITCLASGAMYLTMGFGVNYYLDIGEYGYYKTGKDFRTLSMSMSNIPMKVSMAIGGALSGYTLAWIGFDKFNQANLAGTLDRASEEFAKFSKTFMAIYCFVPAVCTLAALLIFKFGYKITDADAVMYAQENAKRAAAAREAAAK